MENLINTTLSVSAAVVIAIGGLIITYLQKKTKQLEGKVKDREADIKHLHNGFRDEVKSELSSLNTKFTENLIPLKTDFNMIKRILLEEKSNEKVNKKSI